MSIPQNFEKLKGRWSGTNRLHLPWIEENPVQESKSQAAIDSAAKEKFLKIEYDWVFENERQDGLLLFSREKGSEKVSAVWIDSWHNSDNYMKLEGKAEPDSVLLKGFYAVPQHPDWGWRILLEFAGQDSFSLIMFNVSPDGEETLAVEAFYRSA